MEYHPAAHGSLTTQRFLPHPVPEAVLPQFLHLGCEVIDPRPSRKAVKSTDPYPQFSQLSVRFAQA
jgi:hypothetical protein